MRRENDQENVRASRNRYRRAVKNSYADEPRTAQATEPSPYPADRYEQCVHTASSGFRHPSRHFRLASRMLFAQVFPERAIRLTPYRKTRKSRLASEMPS